MFEAAREGLPVIAIPWSGHLDFLTNEGESYFQEVDYSLSPISQQAHWEGVLQPDSMWAYAKEGSYKKALRDTFNNWDECKGTALKLQELISTRFAEEKLYKNFCESIYEPTDDELEWMKELSEIEII